MSWFSTPTIALVSQFFLCFIFYPGTYRPSSLAYSIAMHEIFWESILEKEIITFQKSLFGWFAMEI
jgi:hypothetical protein